MNFEELTTEQQEKACACKTPEDTLALAEEGTALSDEGLEVVSGGRSWVIRTDRTCSNHHEKLTH